MAGSSFFTPQGILDFLGFGKAESPGTLANAPPGWFARLGKAAYKSPSGKRIPFEYVDVSREYELRGTAFEFPEVNDAYVQRKGFGSRKYPLTCYFSGPNCDLKASAFESALTEPGLGVLEHPMYGTLRNVVPFGTVTRNDALGTAANQSIVQVTFWTTTGAVYPNADPATQHEILTQVGAFNEQAAQQFASKANTAKVADRENAIATIKGHLKKVSSAMSAVSGSVTAVRRQMQELEDAINFGIDVLIGQPLLLAQQISNLIQAPARATAGIASRLDGYDRMIQDIFGSAAAQPGLRLESIKPDNPGALPGTLQMSRTTISNNFHISDLFVQSAVAGSIIAATARPATGAPPTFATRNQAIAAADAIAEQHASVVDWREAGFEALSSMAGGVNQAHIDTGESYSALHAAVSISVGFLVVDSFGLQAERSIVLDRARTIVDLCAELHGVVDEKLDQIIDANNLSGDEILELPAGKTIVYYPAG
jgi:hypothetical protein